MARVKAMRATVAVISALNVALFSSGAIAQPKQPNIVIILGDDLGFADMGSFGSEIQTPNLDALAREGVRFTNFYTHASCSPTRAMLLSGVDTHRNGLGNGRRPTSGACLAMRATSTIKWRRFRSC